MEQNTFSSRALSRAAAFGAITLAVCAAISACTGTNGETVPSEVFDAAPLDARKPSDPFEAGSDAPSAADAGVDAKADGASDAGTDGATSAVARINEVYADNNLDGDNVEYVEIRAPQGTPVGDLKLRIVHGDGTPKYEVAVGPANAVVGGSGLWVVGGSQVFRVAAQDRVDNVVPLASWGLDNTRGVVQLLRGPQRTLIDVVGYDRDPDAGALPAIASPPTQTSEGLPAIAPRTTRKAFGRKTNGPDTNVNRADFCAMDPTPGYPQAACL